LPRLLVPDADRIGETLPIQPPDQLDRDVHISISSPGDDGRREIVSLHNAQSVSAPAEPNSHVGLFGKTHFVGVNTDEQMDGRISCPRTADPKRCTICSRAPGGIPTRRSIGRADARSGYRVG
jgi:hypothetical protein